MKITAVTLMWLAYPFLVMLLPLIIISIIWHRSSALRGTRSFWLMVGIWVVPTTPALLISCYVTFLFLVFNANGAESMVIPGDKTLYISHYDPALGGINCQEPCGVMASGQMVDVWYGKAIACPSHIPFWQIITIKDVGSFVCLDRGGKIVSDDNGMWIDILVRSDTFNNYPEFGYKVDASSWGYVVSYDCEIGRIYQGYGTVTQLSHGNEYGHNAIDISAGNGATVVSPISGMVTDSYLDELDNSVIIIKNSCYEVTLLHGNWTVKQGDYIAIGDIVGTESNIGNTVDSNGDSCNGHDCGYHTHLNIFDIKQGKNLDLEQFYAKSNKAKY